MAYYNGDSASYKLQYRGVADKLFIGNKQQKRSSYNCDSCKNEWMNNHNKSLMDNQMMDYHTRLDTNKNSNRKSVLESSKEVYRSICQRFNSLKIIGVSIGAIRYNVVDMIATHDTIESKSIKIAERINQMTKEILQLQQQMVAMAVEVQGNVAEKCFSEIMKLQDQQDIESPQQSEEKEEK